MVCFDISIVYPLQKREKINVVQIQRLEHLRKYYNADIIETKKEAGHVIVRYAVCDFDAVGLLRDISDPLYCVEIKILRTNICLYSFKKITGVSILPPRDSNLLKQVYWTASQLERRYTNYLISRK